MKLWGGRFRKETDTLVNDFNSSIQFDCRMYREDIEGSLAHAKMLAGQGIISREDEQQIRQGLQGILADVEAGKIEFTADNEDIHMNVEALLTQRIGEAGKRLHTARSRNDQVAVDLRLYLRREIDEIIGQILDLEQALLNWLGEIFEDEDLVILEIQLPLEYKQFLAQSEYEITCSVAIPPQYIRLYGKNIFF